MKEKNKRTTKKLTPEEFLRRSKEIHGDKYDYSKAFYKNGKTKIIIICKEHGEFLQNPREHLRHKRGCQKCYMQHNGHVNNREDFIKKATKIHGDKYDYSHLNYTGSILKLELTCKIHGIFMQKQNSHLSGKGCPQCGKDKIEITHDKFMKRARELYGDKYRYNKVQCINGKSIVKIYCEKHKEYFSIMARKFLGGTICPKCGNENRSTKQLKSNEDFIREAQIKHDNKYTYKSTHYRGGKHRVKITCPYHGVFEQLPFHHLKGHGCIKCMGAKSSMERRFTLEDFLEKANLIHQDKYNYDEVQYLGCDSKIKILCKEHNTYFYQTPYCHIKTRSGCPTCAIIKAGIARRLNINELIEKAKKIHKNKYNYSKVIYTGCDDKVEIICPVHGSFFQAMYSHVNLKNGCPSCYGRISAIETRWLEENKIPNTKENRQVNIRLINGSNINVDGYIPEKREIYEFFGDYWHGNILVYKKGRINVACGKTYLELYEKTIERIGLIKESGYNLIYIWERDYRQQEKAKKLSSNSALPNSPPNMF